MKTSNTSTNKLTWSSTLVELLGKSSTKTIEKLNSRGIITLYDLLWIFPLRIIELPPIRPFDQALEGQHFIGRGKILNIQAKPNFWAKGKGRAMLFNISVHVKDLSSDSIATLRWFNCYSSVKDKLANLDLIEFLGIPKEYSGQLQFPNPDFHSIDSAKAESVFSTVSNDLKIQYPTFNTISGTHIKKIIDKLPKYLWDQIEESLPAQIINEKKFLSLSDSFKVLHAKIKPTKELESKTEERLIYEEFFEGQLKIYLRRKYFKKPKSKTYSVNETIFKKLVNYFPYPFTNDQFTTIKEIYSDFQIEHPMMRLVQGDVGCGKTWVALMSALVILENKAQVAFMCPTEALALQHFQGTQDLFQNNYKISIILGSTPAKEKKSIQAKLAAGEIDLIIGTHSLIQDTIQFKELGLAIIDEQHKFGVDQRIKLTSKGNGTHCLIMSATPIPRSLSLTQYGDLDISTIKTMPLGRKGHKTRIVTEESYSQYLNFIKTRLTMKEQVYIVVPAITENPDQDFHNLESVLEKYKKYFPEYKVSGLHGQMKSADKALVFNKFTNHEIDVLVATSVIEVGINVLNATIMAILNPERFGLSSLHQLRGRVGRGSKPGFCFLVNDKEINAHSIARLKVIENNTDGFKIAEEDLRLRGEGDLFGTEQSGAESSKRFANIITHSHVLFDAKQDAERLIKENNSEVQTLLNKFSSDERIFTTV